MIKLKNIYNKTFKNLKILKSFIIDLIQKINEDEVSNSAASLSYYFILSIFPLLLFLMALVSHLPINETEIYKYIYDIMPNTMGEYIVTTLRDMFNGNNDGILTFGILTTIYSASTGIFALINAFNKSYGIKDNRNFVLKRLLSILILIIVISIIILMIFSFVFGEYIINLISTKITLNEGFYTLWYYFKNIIPVFFTFLSLSLVYYLSINKKIKFREVLIGSLFSTFSIMLITKLFSIYVNLFSKKTVTYGSVGTIMMLIFWLFLMAYILVVGSQINSIILKYKDEKYIS